MYWRIVRLTRYRFNILKNTHGMREMEALLQYVYVSPLAYTSLAKLLRGIGVVVVQFIYWRSVLEIAPGDRLYTLLVICSFLNPICSLSHMVTSSGEGTHA